jgi:hypothetical protein
MRTDQSTHLLRFLFSLFLQTQQSYLHENPIFSQGYTLISLKDLQLDQKIVYIPSFQTLSKYLSLFIELSVTLTDHSFLIPQTILRWVC